MIHQLGQIMVYVNNQDRALSFWTEILEFVIVEEINLEGMRWIEVAPSLDSETSIILHDKEKISSMQPELNVGTPSLMFFTNDLDELYSKLKNMQITVGDIVTVPSGKVFNFADYEDNYFAVMQKAKE
ncbi:VOC family protein [Bacillus coahuilensis]|uniref:VOC family protein n=1 Tax=Bacillus coahuilensis TaxID=408580 RepID=UPI0001851501|nr:VOC family protein [Bacillus coahuilensis]